MLEVNAVICICDGKSLELGVRHMKATFGTHWDVDPLTRLESFRALKIAVVLEP